MTYENLSCITQKVGIRVSCIAQGQLIKYWLDDLGISLVDVANTADERYIQGMELVEAKKRQALDDVVSWLTYNTTKDCDLDTATGILCNNAQRIAKAMWYRVAALIFKDIAFDTNRYNEFIHYGADKALAQMIFYDSDFRALTQSEVVEAGMYQKELEMLIPVRDLVEQTCAVSCKGTRWQIVIP